MSAKKAKRTVTRLHFSKEERSSPELQKATQKADKAANKLEKAAKRASQNRWEPTTRTFPLVP